MSQQDEIVISSKNELDNLSRLKRSINKLTLKLPGLSDAQNMKYQIKLNDYHNECGCRTGSAVSIFATLSYLIVLILKNEPLFELVTISTLFLIFILSGGIGKLTGIMRAKFRFRSTLSELKTIS